MGLSEVWALTVRSIVFLSEVASLIASGIAIYLFIFKREAVRSVFKVLKNYANQISLSELRSKLERLNELNANDSAQRDDVVNIYNEIVGQLRGNDRLRSKCSNTFDTLVQYAENPKSISEARKRSIVSELRETLRHVDLEDDGIFGG